MPVQRALVSVSDKEGIVGFCRALAQRSVELISTGGTARVLGDAGLDVRSVESLTGFPELLQGRIKTLHPRIHGGILYKRDQPGHVEEVAPHGILPIDLVIVNLYPFESRVQKETSRDEAMELVDIGGPALLRAAAKNHAHVAPVCRPARYGVVLEELQSVGDLLPDTRALLALEAFEHTARYDALIAEWLRANLGAPLFSEELAVPLRRVAELRYGENQHQRAAVYAASPWAGRGVLGARRHQGRELSYNNILDLHVALEVVREFEDPAVGIIKHATPSGIAVGATAVDAWERAYATDTVSPFGGTVAINRPLDEQIAKRLTEFFLECVIAPGYSPAALQVLAGKPKLRVLEAERTVGLGRSLEARSVSGGMLIQEPDVLGPDPSTWKVVTTAQPTPAQLRDVAFGIQAVRHIRSNAIVLVRDRATVGIGAGQTSRVDAVELAVRKAGPNARGSVLVSDAFFPFRDGVDVAVRGGVGVVAHPGGSIRDDEVIRAAQDAGVPMVFTGQRGFRH